MKNRLNFTIIAGAVFAIACAILLSPADADARRAYEQDICVVTSSIGQRDVLAGDGVVTLHYAIQQAANATHEIKRCRNKILVRVPSIDLKDQLVIEGTKGAVPWGDDVEDVAEPADDFVIAGDMDGNRVLLNAAGMRDVPGGSPKCVVVIRSSSPLKFENFQITGVKQGYSGICVESTQVALINVGVRGGIQGAGGGTLCNDTGEAAAVAPAEGDGSQAVAEGSAPAEGDDSQAVAQSTGSCDARPDGIKFCAGATDNVIDARTEVKNMAGCAVNLGEPTPDGWSSNRIVPLLPTVIGGEYADYANMDIFDSTNLDDASWYSRVDEALGETDADGLIKPADGDYSLVSSYYANSLFRGSSDIHTCLSYKGTRGNKVEIRGFVINGDTSESPVAETIVRMQIYTSNQFYGYVGPEPADGTFGMQPSTGGTLAGEIQTSTGFFKFLLPEGMSDIILVPEDTAHRIGSPSPIGSSPVITVVGSVMDCDADAPCWQKEIGAVGCSGTTDETDSGGGGTIYRQYKLENCNAHIGQSLYDYVGPQVRYDTDGDGLTDDQEDSGTPNADGTGIVEGTAFNCRCDDGESCFLDPDTDDDGIPDGSGGGERDGEFACKTYTIPNGGTCTEIVDTDGDGVHNAKDPDSDGDGRSDTDEDRNEAISILIGAAGNSVMEEEGTGQGENGFLYDFGRTAGGSNDLTSPIMLNEEPVECSLDPQGSQIGVQYDWYKVKREGGFIIEEPTRIRKADTNFPGEPPTDYDHEVLICRSKVLSLGMNFNGKLDKTNNETDAYGTPDNNGLDTDEDGFCDGGGSKCEGMTAEPPGCATIHATDDAVRPGCAREGVKPCGGDEDTTVLYTTMYKSRGEYVGFSPTGVLNFWGESGMPKIFSDNVNTVGFKFDFVEIETSCADSDNDGIPDCVEVPEGKGCCSNTTGLCWNDPDSDGDGFRDGRDPAAGMPTDVCPTTEGNNDGVSEDPLHVYSCNSPGILFVGGDIRKEAVNCFLNRDEDLGQLRDCEEDVNLDGRYDQNKRLSTPEDPITAAIMATIESDPFKKDTDNDGIEDYIERKNPVGGTGRFTNPANDDSDGDTLIDGGRPDKMGEDRDGSRMGEFNVTIIPKGSEGCTDAFNAAGSPVLDSDPTNPDTDGDTLNDNVELAGEGEIIVGDAFIQAIADPATWLVNDGVPMKSNPRSPDSDGDDLADNLEYSNGVVRFFDSNPCMLDSDHDAIKDSTPTENRGSCRLSATNTGCENVQPGASAGVDSDADGLPDLQEAMLGTYASASVAPAGVNPQDSDNDGIKDGEEDADHDGIWDKQIEQGEFGYGESHPMMADSDEDGLNDGWERRLTTDPNNHDTDGDGILDGLEDKNHNGQREATETDAKIIDTDNDGLCDGSCNGIGEDLNVNGVRDVDENGNWTETDPTNADSDMDGEGDYDEMTAGGGWNPNRNIGSAVTGRQGCSMAAGAGEPGSMYFMLGIILAAMRVASRRMRRSPA